MSMVPPRRTAQLLRRAARNPSPLWLPVSGRSMHPAIPAGARVHIAAARRPRWGEVWAFCDSEGNILVHRYRRRRCSAFVFQGDAAATCDDPIPADRLVGRVVSVEVDGRLRQISALVSWRWGLRLATIAAARRVRRLLLCCRRSGRFHAL
ncbi:MAG: hypothetical protein AVDCRST_MAG76-3385 [uncultured Acidimicrobiales bacterium]|uniref:Peptidase S24/S26A/S26B/S26C domain-containing protein n=1 Tax=uncultured Acidimicrobiales bacterium TaxID=310071 RepID=A0A6J4JAF7_9ACTN|nr:MAG: hypothetical protein AVDCRST_MAG76-3385 [uncultured Acidimicrobiales bacterium]